MVAKLSYEIWLAALLELKAHQLRARMTGSLLLANILRRAIYNLEVDRSPMLAGLLLRNTLGLVKYPSLRRSLNTIAETLLPYATVELDDVVVVRFPEFAPQGDSHRHSSR